MKLATSLTTTLLLYLRESPIMANSLIFKNENLGEVRVIFIDNEPLFCLSDICKALNLTNPTMVLNAIKSEFDDDLSLTYPIIDNLGRKQNALLADVLSDNKQAIRLGIYKAKNRDN